MPGSLAALLCLGMYLSQSIMAQKDDLPKPSLWAVPGSVIPWGKSVIVRCQGAEGAHRFLLEKDGSTELRDMLEVPGPWKEAEFFIPDIAAETAGRYRCRYQRQSHWSELSDPLELVVTGLYPKPSISVKPGSTVAVGQGVTLHCESQLGSDRYVLYKTTGANAPHALLSSDYHANFLFPSVTDSNGGTYLCYSFDSDFPFLWSTPSDTLVLKIAGSSQDSHVEHAPPNYDYVAHHHNFLSLRLILVGVTLAILGALVNEIWRNRGSAQPPNKKPLA
ncbi:platelet glycoprotein VI-like isoform X1 [Antechinus flavipes]|uniref:platelet glycoprotein VI-like isoform X1 n=1 Tax=Antechinus flavipes TaxID=38775 RepID=UPI0022369129|nr:platelet glycoprotein VI-like isoform X1 [Antechinus flavipes]